MTETFGEKIRRLRLKRGLLAKDVAQKVGVSLPYISQLESDRAIPSEALARRIASQFSQDEDELVFLARRTQRNLDALLRSAPRSATTYITRTATSSDNSLSGAPKSMVRLIAQSKETLESVPATFRGPGEDLPNAHRTECEQSLSLVDTFDIVRPSVVAFASRMVGAPLFGKPLFPEIIGTGFIVDRDGIVATNDHVIDALQKLPPHPVTGRASGIAIVWGAAEPLDGELYPIHFVEIKGCSRIRSFGMKGPNYGEDVPDIGFVQLKVREVPALPLATRPNILKQGVDVATAGFPLGTKALVPYGKLSQLTPTLRRGIVSSVLPFPCPNPHGFTIDVMSQGGASGSPVFLTTRPEVVGIVHAGIQDTNLTYALPPLMIRDALRACIAGRPLDLSDVPTLEELARNAERIADLRWSVVGYKPAPETK